MKLLVKHIVFIFLILFSSFAHAQGDTKKEKIDALRADYIKKKVSMTAKESDGFWPLYNEMNDKLDAARNAFKAQYGKQGTDFATDKDAETYLNAELALKQKEYELCKEYFEKFKKVLPVKKVAAVRRAEEAFKKELVNILKGG